MNYLIKNENFKKENQLLRIQLDKKFTNGSSSSNTS